MSRLGNVLLVHDGDVAAAANDVREAGFVVTATNKGREGLRLARCISPDLVMIRRLLPDISGLDVCKLIKTDPRTSVASVIILDDRADEAERIAGLEAGADDVLAEQVSNRELVARLRSVLPNKDVVLEAPAGKRLRVGTLVLDANAHTAEVDGADVPLTLLEFRLLWTLASSNGVPHTRSELLQGVWGPNIRVEARTVDQHIKRLRLKLASEKERLQTVRHMGYRFDCG
ncbi:MAG TPA: response regulator transcription factor [Polyangiaceae bacterium]|nr:response regulator transcription factor [Polyangiaceae bacterium]